MASATALEAMRGQIKNLHITHQLIMLSLPYLISLHFEYDSKKNIESIENCFFSLDISSKDTRSSQNQ